MRPDMNATLPQDNQRPPPAAIKEGAAALAWLETPAVREKLDDLYRRCPWATRFQSWEFIIIWYRCYQATSEPVLVYREDGERLTGLFALARDRASGRLMVAGDHQAEYQGWLALPDDGDSFLEAALQTIKQRCRPDQLRLRYLPAGAPTAWLQAPLACGALVRERRHQRPLFCLADPEKIADSLKKKANKSRLNRLKRLGEVRLRHLQTAAELQAVIDEIIAGYDLRQGAANGVCPFTDDPEKRRFHLELMAHPGLMQASVLTVGERTAAAHLGLHDGDSVVVGVFGHAPAFGQHSPGKFLMLMLGADLAADGKRWIDLTPGGAWKDRFATDHDQVLEVTIFFKRSLARRQQAAATALTAARSSLALVGATPDDARRFAQGLGGLRPLLDRTRAAIGAPQEPLVFCLNCADYAAEKPETGDIARDRTEDLLRFDPKDRRQSRQDFLAACEEHLASGHRLYSRVDQGRLGAVAWLIDGGAPGGFSTLPGKTAWLAGPPGGLDLDPHCLQAILEDVAGHVDRIAVTLAANDGAARTRLLALGFKPWSSRDAPP
jgi:CelD/BcsL family acetyltransferase involved in cellulose biosynthesis